MVVDQASKLREEAAKRANNPCPRVIAVTSGKGGVGKTNLVANLGICLAEQGNKVLLMDADIGTANLDVLFGIFPKYSLYEVMRGERTLDEVVVPVPGGIELIPGAAAFNEVTFLDSLKKEQIAKKLGDFTEKKDFLLIDTGAGISKNVLAFISAASEVIIVLTPEPTSMADAYGLLKLICRFNPNQQIHLVVNMANSILEARQTAGRMTSVSSHFLQKDINILGFVLDNNCVGQAVREQVPFVHKYPKSGASVQVRAIASALAKKRAVEEPEKHGFVSRLLRLFS